ncbi:phage major capsid protein [Enterococcus viikkiensis]
MNKIQELMENRKKAWDGAKAFVEAKKDNDGLMSEEDAKTYAEMEAKVKNFTIEIERMQSMEAMEREMEKPMSQPLTSQPMSTENKNEPKKTGRASAEYKAGVLEALRSNFRNVSNVLQEGVDTAGGYLVPEEYDSRLIEGLTSENIMRKLGTIITTTGDHKINIAGAKPGASWIEEGGDIEWKDGDFSQILLDAHKLHVAIKVTDELLYDNAFNLENYILNQFAKALANAEEDAFLNGDGVHKPLGIFAETGGGQVSITTKTQSAITADEIIDLVYSLEEGYRKNAKFILNDQTVALIRKLKDNNGAYLWQPSMQAGQPDMLFGYPVYTSPYVPNVAAGNPVIAFGDFSYYNIGDRGVRSFDQLRELFAGNGMVGFLAKERVDGKLVLPEAVQILKMKASTAS